MTGELLGTLAFAFGVGVAAFFAPCSYALLPGYVGYYVAATGEETAPLAGAVTRGLAAAAGAVAALLVLGAIALVVGEALATVLPALEYGIGLALIALGAWVLVGGAGTLHVVLPRRRASVWGFGLFGAVYAVAATACVLPLFLALVLRSLTMSPAETLLVFGALTGGFGALMLAVTVAVAVGHSLGLERIRRTDWLIRAAGVLMILAGLGQLFVAIQ